MLKKTLMIQGTASSAGKSILVTALCRILKQDGYHVAPFKAQNMALNSFVTKEGGEIGRSQASQAEAAGIEPSILMNPILLKPEADSTSQVIVLGKARGTSGATDYYKDNFQYLSIIDNSLKELCSNHDVVLMEGAGSPAEINLMDKEIANMRIACLVNSPVILVADIDRGGVFASIVGTMELLPANQRELIKGFVINKFRGDITLLKPGLEYLEGRYNQPVIGVIPYIKQIGVAQEDSVYLDERRMEHFDGRLDVCVIRLPHISNYDDFDPLESSCNVRYVSSAHELGNPDLIIIPGTKTTIADLFFLKTTGLAELIICRAQEGTPIAGICGGYQILGNKIYDSANSESALCEADGLGLLDIDTDFDTQKVTSQVKGIVTANSGIFENMQSIEVTGYEIHMGNSSSAIAHPVFSITKQNKHEDTHYDGNINPSGSVFGTYIHGIFNNTEFMKQFIKNLSKRREIPLQEYTALNREKAYDDLAEVVRKNLDMQMIYEIIFGETHGSK